MDIDAATFRTIATHVLPPGTLLSPDQATAIVHAAQLAGGVDLEDLGERRFVDQITPHVCAMAGISPRHVPPASPLPIDDEERQMWIARLAGRLPTPGPGELAYVLAYLAMVVDLEQDPIEDNFVDDLRAALGILRERARDLTITVSSLLTPGVETLMSERPALR